MRLTRAGCLLLLAVVAAGCARGREKHRVATVYFATDRNFRQDAKPAEMFGGERSIVRYGSGRVSIPAEHRLGAMDSPSDSLWQFREDPDRHVVLLDLAVLEEDAFFTEVAARVEDSPTSSAILFVHGFNVSFADAARRAAQVTHDLGFDGAAVLFSWPSQDKFQAYTVDEANVEWTEANLEAFLKTFLARCGARDVYLISHSMGARAMTRAVAALARDDPAACERIAEVILAAPDIDAEVFRRDIAPALIGAGLNVTLYASARDKALASSKTVHGNPRAGDARESLIIVPGIETIDASGVDTSFLAHSYFAETQAALRDIFNLIHFGKRAGQRQALQPVDTPEGRHWVLRR